MTICYFGIYKPNLSRNRIYISGLRDSGIKVLECRDDGSRFAKYWNLWRKHWALRNQYDVMIVGYPGHIVVPFARLISRKPIIADFLGSFQDAETHSHNIGFLRRLRDGLIDWLGVKRADIILLESRVQKDFFIKKFGQSDKFRDLYTGVDEAVFHCPDILNSDRDKLSDKKIVLFRGRLTPESGIFYILEAAALLKHRKDIIFRIIGFHYRLGDRVKAMIRDKDLYNVELFYDYLPDNILREKMGEAAVSLGQFEDNPRLDRTIPHKIFEAMRIGLPIITAYSPAVEELLADNESCLFVKRADPKDLADKICLIVDNPVLGKRLAAKAYDAYKEKASAKVLMEKLVAIIYECKRI